jgi:hypothetical protein
MKNSYEVFGEATLIHVRCHLGTWHECWIDTADLSKLQRENWTWSANPARAPIGKYYVQTSTTVNGKLKAVLMHRYITDANPGYDVHHIDNNGFNNRRSNLEPNVTHKYNMRERFPEQDWAERDRRESLEPEYRTERAIARRIQEQFRLCRQQLWRIRKATTEPQRRMYGDGSGFRGVEAFNAYRDACRTAGVRTFCELKQVHQVNGPKFGVRRGPIVSPAYRIA